MQIFCEFCETFQHLHCYGYHGVDDARVPTTHICYGCLCKGDGKSLKEAQSLAFRRRAIHLLQQGSLDGNSHFAKVLGKEEPHL
jgi:meiosis-specific protein HOP1